MSIAIDEGQSSLSVREKVTDSSISRFDSTAFVSQLLVGSCSCISFQTPKHFDRNRVYRSTVVLVGHSNKPIYTS